MDQNIGFTRLVGPRNLQDQLSAPALSLLFMVSVLDGNRISEDLLTEASKMAELPNYPCGLEHYQDARDELIRASMITRDAATCDLSTLPELQEFIRDRTGSPGLHAIAADVAILISEVWPWMSGTDPTRHETWHFQAPIAERFSNHIHRLEQLFGDEIRQGMWEGTFELGHLFTSYSW